MGFSSIRTLGVQQQKNTSPDAVGESEPKILVSCHPGGHRSQRSGEWFFQESEAALLDHLILRCT